jgi:hypothetical protein
MLWRLLPLRSITTALGFRYLCWIAMMALALFAEGRPAPHLPDLIIDRLPYQPLIDRYNHYLLALSYVPVSVALLLVDRQRFCRYNVTAGLVSLLRGLCIALTGLGPVRGLDVHAGLFGPAPSHSPSYWQALRELSTPGGLLLHNAEQLYLTKDLFFSGHTASTFILLLYVWPHRRLRLWMLGGHLLVVASVFFAHLHYTIDVVGAYAIAFAIFALREGWPPRS